MAQSLQCQLPICEIGWGDYPTIFFISIISFRRRQHTASRTEEQAHQGNVESCQDTIHRHWMLANAGSLIPTNDISSSWVMGASKFFNGITRLLTTKRGSSGTASKREATLNKRGRLSSNYCGICTPNMEDNTHTPPPYRGTELASYSILKFFSLAIRAVLIFQVLHSIRATHNHSVAFS